MNLDESNTPGGVTRHAPWHERQSRAVDAFANVIDLVVDLIGFVLPCALAIAVLVFVLDSFATYADAAAARAGRQGHEISAQNARSGT